MISSDDIDNHIQKNNSHRIMMDDYETMSRDNNESKRVIMEL